MFWQQDVVGILADANCQPGPGERRSDVAVLLAAGARTQRTSSRTTDSTTPLTLRALNQSPLLNLGGKRSCGCASSSSGNNSSGGSPAAPCGHPPPGAPALERHCLLANGPALTSTQLEAQRRSNMWVMSPHSGARKSPSKPWKSVSEQREERFRK